MKDEAFRTLLRSVAREAFDSGKTRLIFSAADANWFSTDQARQLLSWHKYDDARLSVLQTVAYQITDPQNAHTLIETLHFSSKEQARDILQNAARSRAAPV